MTDEAIDASIPSPFEAIVRDVIEPLVRADGGTITWLRVERGVAHVRLGGACAGCPGQAYTASWVILPALRAVDPTLTTVRVELDP